MAEWLSDDPRVAWVKYPGLKGNSNYELAKKYLGGCSGVLTFGAKGGRAASERTMNALKLATIKKKPEFVHNQTDCQHS